MKHKTFLSLLVVLMVFMFLVGCSGESGVITDASESVSESEKLILPNDRPSLIGKVKDIVGNEVTIYKAEINLNKNEDNQNNPQLYQNENEDLKQGSRGSGFKMTGKTETFIIPVGTPIVSMQRGAQEFQKIELTEIKKDQFLQVYMKDDTVVFVQVMGSKSNGQKPGSGERPAGGQVPGGAGKGGSRQQ